MSTKSRINIVILVILAVVISLPSILLVTYKVSNCKFLKRAVVAKLSGVFIKQEFPAFSFDYFQIGGFQKDFEKWFEQNFGGREVLIRLNNQVYYQLFKKSYQYSGNIIIGKEKQLFERGYINDYVNITPVMPKEEQNDFIGKINRVSNLFKRHDIQFILMITPSKAYTYPEYIPDCYRKLKKGTTTYDEIIQLIKAEKLVVLDYQKTTLDYKNNSSLPVFPRGGTHWSYLTACYATIDLVDLIEKITMVKLPKIKIERVILNKKPSRKIDMDLVLLMNLFVKPLDYVVPIPEIKMYNTNSKPSLKLSIVGGSFTSQLIEYLKKYPIFASVERYYYYILEYKKVPSSGKPIKTFNPRDEQWWKNHILKSNVVVLEINQCNFSGNHIKCFLEDALKYL